MEWARRCYNEGYRLQDFKVHGHPRTWPLASASENWLLFRFCASIFANVLLCSKNLRGGCCCFQLQLSRLSIKGWFLLSVEGYCLGFAFGKMKEQRSVTTRAVTHWAPAACARISNHSIPNSPHPFGIGTTVFIYNEGRGKYNELMNPLDIQSITTEAQQPLLIIHSPNFT